MTGPSSSNGPRIHIRPRIFRRNSTYFECNPPFEIFSNKLGNAIEITASSFKNVEIATNTASFLKKMNEGCDLLRMGTFNDRQISLNIISFSDYLKIIKIFTHKVTGRITSYLSKWPY